MFPTTSCLILNARSNYIFFYIYRVCINLASLVKSVSDKLDSPSAAFLSVWTLLGGISEEPPACKNYRDNLSLWLLPLRKVWLKKLHEFYICDRIKWEATDIDIGRRTIWLPKSVSCRWPDHLSNCSLNCLYFMQSLPMVVFMGTFLHKASAVYFILDWEMGRAIKELVWHNFGWGEGKLSATVTCSFDHQRDWGIVKTHCLPWDFTRICCPFLHRMEGTTEKMRNVCL